MRTISEHIIEINLDPVMDSSRIIVPDGYASAEEYLSMSKKTGIVPNDSALAEYMQAVLSAKAITDMNAAEQSSYLESVKAMNERVVHGRSIWIKLFNPSLITRDILINNMVVGTAPTVLKLIHEGMNFIESDIWKQYAETFADYEAFMADTRQQEGMTDIATTVDFCRALRRDAATLDKKVKAYQKKVGAEAITFNEFSKTIQVYPNRPSAKEYAESKGAIMSIGGRLMLLSGKKYRRSFITGTGGTYGLRRLRDADKEQKGELAFDINIPFIETLLTTTYINIVSGKGDEVTVYWPDVAKELKVDSRGNTKEGEKLETRAQAREISLQKFINQIQDLYAPIQGLEGYHHVIEVPWFDPKTELFTYKSPYLSKLISLNMQEEREALEAGKESFNWNCFLLHSSVQANKNQAAVEMASWVLTGVLERGTTTPDARLPKYRKSKLEDKKVFTWSITCAGLIKECPQIKNLLSKQKNTNNRSRTLHRAFASMYKVLKDESDLFSYFKGLTITEYIPTLTTLNDANARIIIRHYGRNEGYERPQLPIPPTTQE